MYPIIISRYGCESIETIVLRSCGNLVLIVNMTQVQILAMKSAKINANALLNWVNEISRLGFISPPEFLIYCLVHV